MRTKEEYEKIIELHKAYKNVSEIARFLNIPRCTVRDCIKSYKLNGTFTPKYETKYNNKIISHKDLSEKQKEAYAYIFGQYLGDGYITKDKRKNVFRLRIFSDFKYPKIIEAIVDNLSILLPNNKIGTITRYNNGKPSWVETYVYNKNFKELFPQHGTGPKHARKISLKKWQKEIIDKYPEQFLKGLIQSDGCRYKQTNTKNNYYYNFTNCSVDIINLCLRTLKILKIINRLNKRSPSQKTKTQAWVITISNKEGVKKLDKFIGSKM